MKRGDINVELAVLKTVSYRFEKDRRCWTASGLTWAICARIRENPEYRLSVGAVKGELTYKEIKSIKGRVRRFFIRLEAHGFLTAKPYNKKLIHYSVIPAKNRRKARLISLLPRRDENLVAWRTKLLFELLPNKSDMQNGCRISAERMQNIPSYVVQTDSNKVHNGKDAISSRKNRKTATPNPEAQARLNALADVETQKALRAGRLITRAEAMREAVRKAADRPLAVEVFKHAN
ncbi:MAG TPA: hypothetical protein PL033_19570 [Candidatus Brocadiia bacterium]|nr:hypothetical protein [Candidatus Brocadiia bacterium]